MARAAPAIVAFNAGELSPRLDGRVDLQDGKYGKGCRTLENFIPLVQGGAQKRSGFRFVCDFPAEIRLTPFVFNRSDSYVLVWCTGKLFFARDGAPVVVARTITGATQANPVVITANAHGFANGADITVTGVLGMTEINNRRFTVANAATNTFELSGVNGTGYGAYVSGGSANYLNFITHPYSDAEIDTLQFAGQNDVVYIACPTQPPMKLSRFSDLSWTLAEVDFDHFPFSPENLDEESFVGASAGTGTGILLTSNVGVFSASMVGTYVKFREIPEAYNPEWKAKVDFDQVEYTAFQVNAASWEIGDRLQYEGRVYETERVVGGTGTTGSTPPVHDSGYASDGDMDFRFINYGYGYAVITNFTDAHRVLADVVVELPRSTLSPGKSVSSMSTANPIVVTMSANHDWETGDRVFFRSITGTFGTLVNNTLQTITRTGATTFTIPLNGAGLAGGLGFANRMDVSRNANGAQSRIYPSLWRWSFGAWDAVRGYPRAVTFFEDRLIWAGTTSNPQTCWASVTGKYEDHTTFDEDDAALVFSIGSSEPIEWLIDQNGLVIGTAGDEFSTPRDAVEPLTPQTVNTIRRRSQYGSRRNVPPISTDNVLLFVPAAGRKLRELVFDDDQGGLVGPDMTRLADHITLGLIKGMAFQSEPNRLLWVWLESGELVCLTYERDEQVTGWHRHPQVGADAIVRSAAVIPHPDGDGDQMWVLVERTIEAATVRSLEYLEKEWTRDMALEDAFFVDSGMTYDGAATATITGLWRLRNLSVEVLADGVSVGPLTVSAAGNVTLPSAASVVQVGLGYDAVLSPMRIEAGSSDGTAQGKTKRFVNVKLRLDQTGEGLFMGPSEDEATEEVALTSGALTDGDTALLPWPGGFESDGIIVIVHSKPTPCTITAILPRMQVND